MLFPVRGILETTRDKSRNILVGEISLAERRSTLQGFVTALVMTARASLGKELFAENEHSFAFISARRPLRLRHLVLASHGGRQQTCEQAEDQKRLQCVPHLLPRRNTSCLHSSRIAAHKCQRPRRPLGVRAKSTEQLPPGRRVQVAFCMTMPGSTAIVYFSNTILPVLGVIAIWQTQAQHRDRCERRGWGYSGRREKDYHLRGSVLIMTRETKRRLRTMTSSERERRLDELNWKLSHPTEIKSVESRREKTEEREWLKKKLGYTALKYS